MKCRSLIAASVLGAGLTLAPLVHAEDFDQVSLWQSDDVSASQDTAAPAEDATATDSGRELAALRAAIASDLDHE
jgi:hypothetical protein